MLRGSQNYWEDSGEQSFWPCSQEPHPKSLQTRSSADITVLNTEPHMQLLPCQACCPSCSSRYLQKTSAAFPIHFGLLSPNSVFHVRVLKAGSTPMWLHFNCKGRWENEYLAFLTSFPCGGLSTKTH